jgi:hypothetical protein
MLRASSKLASPGSRTWPRMAVFNSSTALLDTLTMAQTPDSGGDLQNTIQLTKASRKCSESLFCVQ